MPGLKTASSHPVAIERYNARRMPPTGIVAELIWYIFRSVLSVAQALQKLLSYA
jgi:hypothetical protein